ncbi:MAG: thioredoxin domain-containing protein, partial [Pseudolabrys sp.]
MSSSSTAHENRLAQATSPYLLQHKHNPVDWWTWGPEALAEAKTSNRPILLSVGYAACHWCHVMAHESFEDEATAQVMNELFVNIKVDREERPDIDQIYMNALHLLGEQGGWPLTMFLTPQAEPVWGGTYFPKETRFGRPAFVDVLREVARLFREEPGRIEQNRTALLSRLTDKARPAGKVTIGLKELDAAAMQVGNMFDRVNGGLRGAPKFPQPAILEMLWRAGLRTKDARFFETVEHSLERMSEGGIYDHLGGGFSRYSVDERWLVPHFEKMLYDNAQLLELLALAFQRSSTPLFAQRARETVEWLRREMTTDEGAFAASLDADSEGEEGKFYVWSKNEIVELIGPEAGEFLARYYDVTDEGNFEGHNILNRLKTVPRSEADEARLSRLRAILLEARAGRVRPSLDDKVLADWNGLMIAALVNA